MCSVYLLRCQCPMYPKHAAQSQLYASWLRTKFCNPASTMHPTSHSLGNATHLKFCNPASTFSVPGVTVKNTVSLRAALLAAVSCEQKYRGLCEHPSLLHPLNTCTTGAITKLSSSFCLCTAAGKPAPQDISKAGTMPWPCRVHCAGHMHRQMPKAGSSACQVAS